MSPHLSYTQNDVEKVIQMYNDGIPINDIVASVNFSHMTFYRILKKHNIKPSRWSYSLNKTPESYEKFTQIFLNNVYIPFKCNEDDFRLCRNNGLIDYFDNIDSSNKAYILGLLYADGNIDQSRHTTTITLQERDKDVLYKIKELLNLSNKIRLIKAQKDTWQNCFCLDINSKRICAALFYHGIHPNKSLTLTFPKNIPFALYKDFLRGYIDGDGSIFIPSSRSDCHVNFISTKSFCEDAKLFIENYLEINCIVYVAHTTNNITSVLQIGGAKQVLKFLTWIYDGAELYIQRKYDKYMDLVNMNNSLSA